MCPISRPRGEAAAGRIPHGGDRGDLFHVVKRRLSLFLPYVGLQDGPCSAPHCWI